MTLENQISTNVVMPHPDDAWLRHDDYLLWRHSGCVPEVGIVAQEVAKVLADFWIARWLLVLRHCGFGTPRAFPHQLIGCGRAIVDANCKRVDNWGIKSFFFFFSLPEPMLTFHQYDLVTFILGYYQKKNSQIKRTRISVLKITFLKSRPDLPVTNELVSSFFREVLADESLLNMPERVDWRSCQQSKEQDVKDAEEMREAFKPFDFNELWVVYYHKAFLTESAASCRNVLNNIQSFHINFMALIACAASCNLQKSGWMWCDEMFFRPFH